MIIDGGLDRLGLLDEHRDVRLGAPARRAFCGQRFERFAHLVQLLEADVSPPDEQIQVPAEIVAAGTPHPRAAASTRPDLDQPLHFQNTQGLSDRRAAEPGLLHEFALRRQQRAHAQRAGTDALAQLLREHVGRLRHVNPLELHRSKISHGIIIL